MSKKIAIYGGTFSPPHAGHVRAMEAFLAQETPDLAYVIPTFMAPHKLMQGDATPEQRLTMCHLAFGHLPATVSDMEINRGGKSYTAQTLEAIKAENPEATLVFLCGTDMFLTLHKWYCPERIMALAEIVYVQRETGEDGEAIAEQLRKQAEFLKETFGAVTRPLCCDAIEISSSEMREAFLHGRDTSHYLSAAVREYIDQWMLYRT